MGRLPEIGNVQLYPNRPLTKADKNGYVLKFFCPILRTRIRKNCGTRERREARKVLRECQERLLNGEYVRSGGAITERQAIAMGYVPQSIAPQSEAIPAGKSWQECYERYAEHRRTRIRASSLVHALSRLNIAERVFEAYRAERGMTEGLNVRDVLTLDMLDYLQDRLLAGDEGRYEVRSPNTVNSMMKAIMTFVRFCYEREWIDKMPPVKMLEVDEVMKGRPVTGEEFDRMLDVTPRVVGETAAADWQFVLRVLWESGFRIADLLDFSWEDERHIHPVWPTRPGQHPTILIPSSQKNGRLQEIPMLPGLVTLLGSIPEAERTGWVVSVGGIHYSIQSRERWYRPSDGLLRRLADSYSNVAIAEACRVTDASVRKWLKDAGIKRPTEFQSRAGGIPADDIAVIQQQSQVRHSYHAIRSKARLTKERASRIVGMIGKEAGIVVRKADARTQTREKFASAHDLRRGSVPSVSSTPGSRQSRSK
ncbi:hypothetical protein [Planctomicrobium sp. SH527]|uniref:hypothetical protein n=1 Tax=Planctomicrobium sp. SH527 TaxID=3448123 RepID=UPI003F5B665B